MNHFFYLFLLFITYSILGWIIESTYCSIGEKRIINRGFLIGPYCPIYGSAAVLIVVFLSSFKNNLLVLFFLSMFLSGIMEYITSYVLEKTFKLSLWDYSNKKFNINGRVCLKNLLMFGALAILVVEVINPLIDKFYEFIPNYVTIIILVVTFISFVTDIILTSIAVLDIKKLSNKTLNLDELTIARNKITDEVRQEFEEKTEKLRLEYEETKDQGKIKLNFIHRRFVKAFPNLKPINPKESFEILKSKINKYRK